MKTLWHIPCSAEREPAQCHFSSLGLLSSTAPNSQNSNFPSAGGRGPSTTLQSVSLQGVLTPPATGPPGGTIWVPS